jgi:hypothetical protein
MHGHHKVAASIFVASLIVGAAMIMSAELIKPERYEYHPGTANDNYVIYDRETGRATTSAWNAKNPTAELSK